MCRNLGLRCPTDPDLGRPNYLGRQRRTCNNHPSLAHLQYRLPTGVTVREAGGATGSNFLVAHFLDPAAGRMELVR